MNQQRKRLKKVIRMQKKSKAGKEASRILRDTMLVRFDDMGSDKEVSEGRVDLFDEEERESDVVTAIITPEMGEKEVLIPLNQKVVEVKITEAENLAPKQEEQDRLIRNAIEIMKSHREMQKLEPSLKAKVSNKLRSTIGRLAKAPRLRRKSAGKAFLLQEGSWSLMSVNDRMNMLEISEDDEPLRTSDLFNQTPRESFFKEGCPIKVIDLMRGEIQDLVKDLDIDSTRDSTTTLTEFGADYIGKMIEVADEKSHSAVKSGRVQVKEMKEAWSIAELAIIGRRGLDIDNLVTRIKSDIPFQYSLLKLNFPNQQRHPELFGLVTDDTVEYYEKIEEEQSYSRGSIKLGETDWIPPFHRASSNASEPAEHPLYRALSEGCDLQEIEKLRKRGRSVNLGVIQLLSLNQVLDSAQAAEQERLEPKSKSHCRRSTIDAVQTSWDEEKSKNGSELQSLIRHIFASKPSQGILIDGIGSSELKKLDI